MRLDLERTPAGRSEQPVTGKFALDFDADNPTTVDVSGDLVVDNLEGRCVVRGDLAATCNVPCGRCLQDFSLQFEVPVELVVLRDSGEETEDSETLVLHQRTGEIDLTEAVREATVLAVPQSRFCRDQCQGLCAQCGANLNETKCDCVDDDVDPRWDNLPDLE